MIIYFIRHGETVWNKKRILQGHKDSPLTLKGEKSAEKKGKVLAEESIEIIYSSDLGRCVQTARIINKSVGVKIIKTPELRERNFGRLNGQPNAKVKKMLDLDNPGERAPDGESFNDQKKRVSLFIKNLSIKKFKKVLLIIHDGTTRAILSNYYSVGFNSKKCKTSDSAIYLLEVIKRKIKERSLKIIKS